MPLIEPNFQTVRILVLNSFFVSEDVRGNKSFYHYISVQRLNKENVGLLLNVAGDLGTVDTNWEIMTWIGGQLDQ